MRRTDYHPWTLNDGISLAHSQNDVLAEIQGSNVEGSNKVDLRENVMIKVKMGKKISAVCQSELNRVYSTRWSKLYNFNFFINQFFFVVT